MPRVLDPPVGDRFFARIESGRNECPRCGYLDRWATRGPAKGRVGDPHKRLKAKRTAGGWNPLTSRWQCPSCRMTFVFGLLAWPVAKGGQTANSLPRDQVPSYRQLAQLRAQGGGLWMRDAVKRYRATGSNICAGCSCPPGCAYTDQRDRGCPLHGDGVEGEEG